MLSNVTALIIVIIIFNNANNANTVSSSLFLVSISARALSLFPFQQLAVSPTRQSETLSLCPIPFSDGVFCKESHRRLSFLSHWH
mmetsp:Transcript_4341/g.12479  ORF Transcript_4341/g.12479 Transcript_4341/m.12479 type:complete len:85 (+) Transcript_4341:3387-3641(+)